MSALQSIKDMFEWLEISKGISLTPREKRLAMYAFNEGQKHERKENR